MRFSLSYPQEACFEEAQRLRDIFEQHAAFVWRALRNLGGERGPRRRDTGSLRGRSRAARDVQGTRQDALVAVRDLRPRQPAPAAALCAAARARGRAARACGRGHAANRARATRSARAGQRLLDVLPEAQREVFLLYEIEHMTMAEVAAIVGCPLQTAYARLHKARERVQAEVASLRARGELP